VTKVDNSKWSIQLAYYSFSRRKRRVRSSSVCPIEICTTYWHYNCHRAIVSLGSWTVIDKVTPAPSHAIESDQISNRLSSNNLRAVTSQAPPNLEGRSFSSYIRQSQVPSAYTWPPSYPLFTTVLAPKCIQTR